jgi:hypothetical protein
VLRNCHEVASGSLAGGFYGALLIPCLSDFYCRVSSAYRGELELCLPETQYGHRKCCLFGFPHAGHLLMAVISFNLLLCIKRFRFFMCDVFFFGTAFRIPSHMSDSIEGIEMAVAGNAIESDEDRRRPRDPKTCRDKSCSAPARRPAPARLAMAGERIWRMAAVSMSEVAEDDAPYQLLTRT